MDLIIVALFGALALLGFAAQVWGVDSRQMDLDPRVPQSTGIF